ncbi:TPR repeat domain-containing protein [Naegleria gruberi]|uniref:TPR repeat domain-containing protein n=1 Tax=Naegleria gruberi TaxID=5762 RepID=D2VB06_NAEGR|nr:TPR repeat domain-containing protein [Naegleria gruberi]EFC46175.1 TPR repeat domain-containing protein [Naegleria gruberi]|eukprot:XP_002678919.1 TPR repeat domain-containing protein [Naegleria gruberi strain NEG-M]
MNSGYPPNGPPPGPINARLDMENEKIWMRLGKLAESMNEADKAIHYYERILRYNQYHVQALTSIASIYRMKDPPDFQKAVEYYHTALQTEDNNTEIWGNLGHCFLMMDDLTKAYTAYHQAIYNAKLQNRTKQDPHLWYGIGILYERYNSLDNAEEAFRSVLKMDAQFEKINEIYFRLGIIYKQQKKYEQSLECFGIIRKNPPPPLTEADIWFQIGHVYELKKDFQEAKNSYEKVLKFNPNHSKVLQQLGWLYHQNTEFQNLETAITYLQQSIDADPSSGQTWYLLGRCFMAQKRYRYAYNAYQQAVFRDGKNPTFWCSIGVLYYQINQYRDALDAYSRAIRLNPFLSEVWYDLGTLYESCSQIPDALDAYQRAADLDQNNEHIQQRLMFLKNMDRGNPEEPKNLTAVEPPTAGPQSGFQSGIFPGPQSAGNTQPNPNIQSLGLPNPPGNYPPPNPASQAPPYHSVDRYPKLEPPTNLPPQNGPQNNLNGYGQPPMEQHYLPPPQERLQERLQERQPQGGSASSYNGPTSTGGGSSYSHPPPLNNPPPASTANVNPPSFSQQQQQPLGGSQSTPVGISQPSQGPKEVLSPYPTSNNVTFPPHNSPPQQQAYQQPPPTTSATNGTTQPPSNQPPYGNAPSNPPPSSQVVGASPQVTQPPYYPVSQPPMQQGPPPQPQQPTTTVPPSGMSTNLGEVSPMKRRYSPIPQSDLQSDPKKLKPTPKGGDSDDDDDDEQDQMVIHEPEEEPQSTARNIVGTTTDNHANDSEPTVNKAKSRFVRPKKASDSQEEVKKD